MSNRVIVEVISGDIPLCRNSMNNSVFVEQNPLGHCSFALSVVIDHLDYLELLSNF